MPDLIEGPKADANKPATFRGRLLEELIQLDEKRGKLRSFLSSEAFDNIDPIQKSLLKIQFDAMATYSQCLSQRIAWLDKEPS